jgi:hypothetical protein
MTTLISRRGWTADDDRRLRALRDGGHRLDTLCRVLDRSPSSVRNRLWELGLGGAGAIVGRGWTEADDGLLARLWVPGADRAAVAAALGRTVDSLKRRAGRLGLTTGVPTTADSPPPYDRAPRTFLVGPGDLTPAQLAAEAAADAEDQRRIDVYFAAMGQAAEAVTVPGLDAGYVAERVREYRRVKLLALGPAGQLVRGEDREAGGPKPARLPRMLAKRTSGRRAMEAA